MSSPPRITRANDYLTVDGGVLDGFELSKVDTVFVKDISNDTVYEVRRSKAVFTLPIPLLFRPIQVSFRPEFAPVKPLSPMVLAPPIRAVSLYVVRNDGNTLSPSHDLSGKEMLLDSHGHPPFCYYRGLLSLVNSSLNALHPSAVVLATTFDSEAFPTPAEIHGVAMLCQLPQRPDHVVEPVNKVVKCLMQPDVTWQPVSALANRARFDDLLVRWQQAALHTLL